MCYAEAFVRKDAQALTRLQAELLEDGQTYWAAYAEFLLATYYQYIDQPDDEASRLHQEAAVTLIESIMEPTAEDLALHSYVLGYGLQWSRGPVRWTEAQRCRRLARLALKEDPTSPRVLYVAANIELRAPGILGNKEEGLQLLLTARDQSLGETREYDQPSWGLRHIYVSLMTAYLDSDEVEAAQAMAAEAQSRYPQDDEIAQLARQAMRS